MKETSGNKRKREQNMNDVETSSNKRPNHCDRMTRQELIAMLEQQMFIEERKLCEIRQSFMYRAWIWEQSPSLCDYNNDKNKENNDICQRTALEMKIQHYKQILDELYEERNPHIPYYMIIQTKKRLPVGFETKESKLVVPERYLNKIS
jgi:hypothetical protein